MGLPTFCPRPPVRWGERWPKRDATKKGLRGCRKVSPCFAQPGWNWDDHFIFAGWAETLLEADRLDEGLSALMEAQTAADQRGERQCEAEVDRLKGELLLKRNSSDAAEAENCFRNSMEIAGMQSGKSLELRATTSLARLLDKQGRRDEARALL